MTKTKIKTKTKKKERILYENFLPEADFKVLENTITSPDFPWIWREGAIPPSDGGCSGAICFSSMLFGMYGVLNRHFDACIPILNKLNCDYILRIKANLDLKVDEVLKPTGFHTDHDVYADGIYTMLLYLNDCNGATIFKEDNAPVKSKRNRAIIFPTSHIHAGCNQTDTPTRFVLNLNFLSPDPLPEGGQYF